MGSGQCRGTSAIEAHRPICYGPVPSRRLGRSLGINNIPPKVCTYSCAYCQVGRTSKLQIDRQTFYEPVRILKDVEQKIEKTVQAGESVDYLSFVPDGEPTLDVNLGREIDLLRSLGIKIAVITNASTLWHESVRDDLKKADWVSIKVDSAEEDVWRKLNGPHPKLELSSVLDGIVEFSEYYDKELVTETMLVQGMNDDRNSAVEIADFLAQVNASIAYLAVPARPPAHKWVRIPSEKAVNRSYQIFRDRLDCVELLTGYEGNSFSQTGEVRTDLLAITAVHPMRAEAVREFLEKAKTDWATVDRMVRDGLLVETEYNGSKFYMRKFGEGCRR